MRFRIGDGRAWAYLAADVGAGARVVRGPAMTCWSSSPVRRRHTLGVVEHSSIDPVARPGLVSSESPVRPAWITGCERAPRPLLRVVFLPVEQEHVIAEEYE